VRGKGYLAGEVANDAHAMKNAEKIGERIVQLLKPMD